MKAISIPDALKILFSCLRFPAEIWHPMRNRQLLVDAKSLAIEGLVRFTLVFHIVFIFTQLSICSLRVFWKSWLIQRKVANF